MFSDDGPTPISDRKSKVISNVAELRIAKAREQLVFAAEAHAKARAAENHHDTVETRRVREKALAEMTLAARALSDLLRHGYEL